jgi:hypothetical protein
MTDDDIRSVGYFWLCQRDLEDWFGWAQRKAVIAADWPELIEAHAKYIEALKLVNEHIASIDAIVKAKEQEHDL